MRFSTLGEIPTSKQTTEVFRGYNHGIKISDGEFYDMENLTSASFPVLSPRGARGTYVFTEGMKDHHPNGLIAKDALCYVDGRTLYINNEPVKELVLDDSKKQLISMGAYIIIMPDKKYVNTADLTDLGDIEATFTTSSNVRFQPCSVDGTVYENATISASEPQSPVNMQIWVDTSSTPHSYKQFSVTSSMWVVIPSVFVKASAPGIAAGFNDYDGVKMTGFDVDNIPQLKDLEGQTSILYGAHHEGDGADDYIIFTGLIDTEMTQSSPLTISRTMPNMDFIIESENRLWGCRYGTDVNGNTVNEIYASKLGDFKNWNCFLGITTDSYVASCGTDGRFTGAIAHLGHPIFFKETCLHKVYGNYPSNYQVQTNTCSGVMKGAGDSLAIVGTTLYYKSRNGICIYDGSLPSEISKMFGDVRYSGVDETMEDVLRNGAVAGAHGGKYYISMKSEVDGTWNLFVYDTTNGLWHREDNTRVEAFCSCKDELYFIEKGAIKTVFGSGVKDTEPVKWMAETGVMGTQISTSRGTSYMTDKKYISRLLIRMSLAIGSRVRVFIQYDSHGEWEHLSSMTGTTLRMFSFMVRPKRCDHFRLKIEGEGEAKIYSISKTMESGSDI